jgi:hypothetical protein
MVLLLGCWFIVNKTEVEKKKETVEKVVRCMKTVAIQFISVEKNGWSNSRNMNIKEKKGIR